MILWEIREEDTFDLEIEIENITVLKGSNNIWFRLVRLVDDFFNNKGSIVTIMEDTQIIHKSDWECLFVPFDAHIQLDKLSTKSPLKSLWEEAAEELYNHTIFNELNDIWDVLREEVELISKRKVEKYGLKLTVDDFSYNHLKKFIGFSSIKNYTTPFDFKLMLIKLFANKSVNKRKLVIVEYPELYTDQNEFQEFTSFVQSLAEKGLQFIIVSNENLPFYGSKNYFLQNVVINQAKIEMVKRKVMNDLPFVVDHHDFAHVQKQFFELVDKLSNSVTHQPLSTGDDVTLTIFYVLSHHLGLNLNIDKSQVSNDLYKFFQSFPK
ncbi:hypothetical protein [Fervidibacillus albus]|uniref:Uncharacterized protein n=1 Tax=Fervidibacillus albus TaxID=2980026 RepID=A0A9E8LUS0_9BACI|nr:hypothetical protein [Fervidibacillus albus]WAA09862.1 hypothetical protein OE104_00315 [Fervidibacillus albus]